jgi:hypothetical protein
MDTDVLVLLGFDLLAHPQPQGSQGTGQARQVLRGPLILQ